MMNYNIRRILILAPHTDDGEIGCGGTIAKLIESGCEVFYCAFSICEQSVPDGYPKDILEKEVKAATRVLGIPEHHLTIHKYPVRCFDKHRQSILDDLIRLRNEIRPDIVFLTGRNDIHQDHSVISLEGIRAFKHSSLLCYEMPWNNNSMNTSAFVALEQRHIDRKTDALKEYKTQQGIRSYMNKEFIESLARVRGVQIGCEYAEAFEILRWLM